MPDPHGRTRMRAPFSIGSLAWLGGGSFETNQSLLESRYEVRGQCLDSLQLTAPSVGREENRPLARPDWSRSRTQEGGCEEGRRGRRAGVEGDGWGEGRGGGSEEGGGGERGGREGDGGGEGGGCRNKRRGDKGRREGRLHQLRLRRRREEQI